jgi:5-methylcytosine-specific restriction enzyme A
MATGAKHPCSKRGCRALLERGQRFCPEHKAEDRQRQAESRPSAAEYGYDRRWHNASGAYLQLNPWCVECSAEGRQVQATVVDHVRPHKGDMVLFWDKSNWRASCKRHHDSKTAREDGGFGNPVNAR